MIGVLVSVLLILILMSIPISAVLFLLSLYIDHSLSPMPLYRALGSILWGASTNYTLIAIPLFIMMGQILLKSGIAGRMYRALSFWLSWLPGGLMHSNIGSCALFAATSGSSVATSATIGTVAMPEMERYKYNQPLFLGTLAAGGTIGILIPPSINMIIYGVLTQTSIPRLYLAAMIPGVLLALTFMAIVLVICLIKPSYGGERTRITGETAWSTIKYIFPPLGIFVIVIGSIYAGLATPTESAALGVLAAFALATYFRQMSRALIWECVEGTIRITAMVMLIIIAAYCLNFMLASAGVTAQINSFIRDVGLSPFETLMMVIVFYIVVGCFMETLSLMVATVPITAAIVIGVGYDAIWFGVVVMLLIEIAMITPPIGVNLYVIQSVRNRGNVADVMIGVIPFFIGLLIVLALVIAFPGLALWLPNL